MDESSPSLAPPYSSSIRPGAHAPFLAGICLVTLVSVSAYAALMGLGMAGFVLLLAGMTGFLLLSWVSIKDLSLALILWMFSMSGFRAMGMGMVSMPGLPDFSFERLFLIWIVLVFPLRILLERKRLEGPFVADALILAHTVYILVQIQLMNTAHFHYWVISNLSPLFAYLYGRHVVRDERMLRNVLIFFALITVYYSLQSLAQHFGWRTLIWPKQILDPNQGLWHVGRSRGPVLHPPYFGQLLAMFLLVLFFFLARAQSVAMRAVTGLALAAALLGLFLTFTRGPWVAVAVAILLLGVLRPAYRRVLAAMGIVAILGGLLGVARLADTKFLQERVQNTRTIESRLGFLANSVRMIRDHPVTGVGYFRFNDYRGLYNQATYIPLYGFIKKSTAAETPIHDIYLGRLAEEGLISSGLLLAFSVVILRAFRRQWRAAPDGRWFNRDTLALMAAMMVCYLLGGMVIDYRYFDLVNVLFFFLAGLIYGFRPAPSPTI